MPGQKGAPLCDNNNYSYRIHRKNKGAPRQTTNVSSVTRLNARLLQFFTVPLQEFFTSCISTVMRQPSRRRRGEEDERCSCLSWTNFKFESHGEDIIKTNLERSDVPVPTSSKTKPKALTQAINRLKKKTAEDIMENLPEKSKKTSLAQHGLCGLSQIKANDDFPVGSGCLYPGTLH